MNRLALGSLAVLFAFSCGPQKTQTVVRKPEARFKYTQSSARPQVFTLDAADSFATVGTLTTFKWTFGDDSPPVEATMPTTQHSYKAAGNFVITLVVSDDKGADSEPSTQQVTVPSVNVTGPKAILTGPSTGMLNTELTFDGAGSTPDGDLKSYAWNFGDGAMAAGATKKSAGHSYTSAGSYRVTLTVTDTLGQSDTAELQVVIGAVGPVALCNWTPQPALQGVPVQFSGAGSTAPSGATVTTYLWDFGDGSPMGTGATVSHTYHVQATFKPKLKVLDSQNRVSPDAPCADVVVGVPPLCSGEYTLVANPNQQSCGGSPTTWGGNKITLVQHADGGMTGTETFNMMPLVYSGTWAGSTFNLTGTYSQSTMGLTIDTDATINATFTGCSGWSGDWVEKQTIQGIGVLCTVTWKITSTRL
jgi:PKD repeat protein